MCRRFMVSDPSCPFPTQPGTKSQTFSRGRGTPFLFNALVGVSYRSYSTSLHNSIRASHEKLRWVHCPTRKSAERLPNFLCCACAVQTTVYWKRRVYYHVLLEIRSTEAPSRKRWDLEQVADVHILASQAKREGFLPSLASSSRKATRNLCTFNTCLYNNYISLFLSKFLFLNIQTVKLKSAKVLPPAKTGKDRNESAKH